MHATRYILYIIGLAFLLQGCNKKSHPNTPDSDCYAISMAPASVGASRALINNIDSLTNAGFVVYSHCSTSGGVSTVFNGEHVYYNYSGGVWTYDNTKYWDNDAYYGFGAYAPYDNDFTVTQGVDGNRPVVMEIPHWQIMDGNEIDLITATSRDNGNNYLSKGGFVDLDFTHIYAQLEVQILRNAFLVSTYKLASLSYKDTPSSTPATYTLDYIEPLNSSLDIDLLNSDNDSIVIKDKASELVDILSTAEPGTTFKHLVLPFTTERPEGFRITLGYTINDVKYYAVVNSGLKTLEAGRRYVLRLNFDSGANIVPKVTMQEWVDEEIPDDDDMYNW